MVDVREKRERARVRERERESTQVYPAESQPKEGYANALKVRGV